LPQVSPFRFLFGKVECPTKGGKGVFSTLSLLAEIKDRLDLFEAHGRPVATGNCDGTDQTSLSCLIRAILRLVT